MDTPSSVIDVMTSEGEATDLQIGRRESFFIFAGAYRLRSWTGRLVVGRPTIQVLPGEAPN